jgi:hypothetical protein
MKAYMSVRTNTLNWCNPDTWNPHVQYGSLDQLSQQGWRVIASSIMAPPVEYPSNMPTYFLLLEKDVPG